MLHKNCRDKGDMKGIDLVEVRCAKEIGGGRWEDEEVVVEEPSSPVRPKPTDCAVLIPLSRPSRFRRRAERTWLKKSEK